MIERHLAAALGRATPFIKRIAVTPRIAKQWLERTHPKQRKPKTRSKIPQYVRDMQTGNWVEDTGNTIKFDVTGWLIDGQNRLKAVVESDETIAFDVAFNRPVRAMSVTDINAVRTAADGLRMADAPDSGRNGAIIRWVIMWDKSLYMGAGGSLMPTVPEILDRYHEDPAGFDAAVARGADCQRAGLAIGAPAGVAHYLFSRINTEDAHQFFDQYVSGANLPDKSAVLVLRNRMARARTDRLTRPEQLALFVKAWNAFRIAEPIDRLQLTDKGPLTNANFPQPK